MTARYPTTVKDGIYETDAPASPPEGLTRYYEIGEDGCLFYGTVDHFENVFGGVGGTEGGVMTAINSMFADEPVTIVDSDEPAAPPQSTVLFIG